MNTNTEKKQLSLAAQIFIALVLAIVVGIALQNYADFTQSYIKPFGTIFLNLLKFIVCPIVLVSILSGIISMSDIRKVGSIGAKTVIYYLCTTAFATGIGLAGAVIFKRFFPVLATSDLAYEAKEAGSERRKKFALVHMKRFGYFALAFFLYNVVSVLVGVPYGVDITIACVGIVIVAFSTMKIKF